jgi:lysophospholipase L1-like esterase
MIRSLVAAALVLACSSSMAQLRNYGDPNTKPLRERLEALASGGYGAPVRIAIIGDSHIAADFFTDRIRSKLQAKYGDGGPGWLSPGKVSNQRFSQAKLDNNNWTTQTVMRAPGDYTLGGVIGQGSGASAGFVVGVATPREELVRVALVLRNGRASLQSQSGEPIPMHAADTWAFPSALLNLAGGFTVNADGDTQIAGVTVDRLGPGLVVDTLGLNGAKLSTFRRAALGIGGQPEAAPAAISTLVWRKPDLIVLAFGTNEAFDDTMSLADYRHELADTVRQLRQLLPGTAILLIGPPESVLKKKVRRGVSCANSLPPAMRAVETTQRDVARAEKTLYWDWAEAMGGACVINRWARADPPLARPDLVHLTREGYELSADRFLAGFGQVFK